MTEYKFLKERRITNVGELIDYLTQNYHRYDNIMINGNLSDEDFAADFIIILEDENGTNVVQSFSQVAYQALQDGKLTQNEYDNLFM